MVLEEIKILIAEGDTNLSNRMAAYLRESGFKIKVIQEAYLLQKTLIEWKPDFLLIDLLFPGFYAQNCLNFLSQRNMLGENGVHVLVLSNHSAELNVRNCLAAGADDFVIKPIKMIDLLQRLALLAQSKRYNFAKISQQNEQQIRNYFQMISLMTEAVNQDKEVGPLRFEIIKMMSMALEAVRVSIISTNKKRDRIRVIRSSDDPKLFSLPLDLQKYPEVQYILRTEKPLFIESLEKDQTMSFVIDEVKTIQFDSMMVLPLKVGSELVGCVSIRMPKDCKKLSFFDIQMAEIAAQLLALTWKFKELRELKDAA